MRNKLFLITIITAFGIISTVSAQNNLVSTVSTATPGQNNVVIGVGAALNSSNNPSLNVDNVIIGMNSGISNLSEQNTFVGFESGYSNSSGKNNTFIGSRSGKFNNIGKSNTFLGGLNTGLNNTSGSQNVFIGAENGQFNTQGNLNTFLGQGSGRNNTTGNSNTFVGANSGLGLISGTGNIGIGLGAFSGNNQAIGVDNIVMGTYSRGGSGIRNVAIGFQSGENLNTGNYNTFLGYVILPTTGNPSNTIILADGASNQQLYIHSNGNVGLGLSNNVIPQNRLEINSTASGVIPNTLGLRFKNFSNNNINVLTSGVGTPNKVLSVNNSGDVILVDDNGGGITNSCLTNYLIPVSNSTGNLSCGQIYDNGASVSIGTTLTNNSSITCSSSGYATLALGSPNSTGNIKLDVNGITRSIAYFAISDSKFKKDIKPIENAMQAIEAIDGKTYLWNREANKDMNFDNANHSGFIAQEIEKVLPHLVATSQNGEKAVNYIELIPYLVEAIKEQQVHIKEQQIQIIDLQTQISTNFKFQNRDLLKYNNTKIISVSPNPSKDIITISLTIEKSVLAASLQVFDVEGKMLDSLTINERDNNITKSILKENFEKGVYIVSLNINGEIIDSKKIIFN